MGRLPVAGGCVGVGGGGGGGGGDILLCLSLFRFAF